MKHGEREGDERQEGKGWRHREGEKGGREGSKEGEREKERGTKYKVQNTILRTYIYIYSVNMQKHVHVHKTPWWLPVFHGSLKIF